MSTTNKTIESAKLSQSDLSIVLRGCCMGAADVVPGVSGGTIALIMGIYTRLVTAISHFDLMLLKQLWQRQWRQAATHVDLRFLMALGCGIALGILSMSILVNQLLSNPNSRALTFAAFFGMIVASAFLVGKGVKVRSTMATAGAWTLGLIGALFAYWLTTLPNHSAEPSLPYLFFCGAVAICAMILPGISGAMILLILGIYVHLTDIPRHLLSGNWGPHLILDLVVFGMGCGCGLLLFSKALRWLLQEWHEATLALLCGCMFGALQKLWPFQQELPGQNGLKFKHKEFEHILPDQFDSHVMAVVATAILSTLAVFAIHFWSRRRRPTQTHKTMA